MACLAARAANRAKDALYNPLLDRWWVRAMRGVVTCLLYHRVDDPDRHPFLLRGGSPVISPEELESDIQLLIGLGARFLTFADIRAGHFVAEDEIGVIVSFDDGFRDNYTTGLEVLESSHVKAVFFQTSGLIDAQDLLWEHALYWHIRDASAAAGFLKAAGSVFPQVMRADALQTMCHLRETLGPEPIGELLEVLRKEDETRAVALSIYPRREHVRRARALGHEIGSHGHRHLKRTSIEADAFEQELASSLAALKGMLDEAPLAFSYPFNSYKTGDREVTGRYFRQAATVDSARITANTDPLWLPRFSWPGPARNAMRQRRWLLTGRI